MASPPPPPGISIYAELLQNIRQVSVAASLPSPANAFTAATVAPDGSAIRLRHDGLDASLALPARVAAAPPSALPIPSAAPSSSLTWRLPLLLLAPGHQLRQDQHRSDLDAVPWPATALLPGGPVGCRGCGGPVVGVGRVRAWKDLPSENWAEMMEFWHCHKPGDHGHGHGHGHGDGDGEHDHGQGGGHGEVDGRADEKSLASRGYGADSAISAQEGVGFVDLTSFLFAEGDCEGILVSFAFFSLSLVLLPQPRVLHSLPPPLPSFAYIHRLGHKRRRLGQDNPVPLVAWSPIQLPKSKQPPILPAWQAAGQPTNPCVSQGP